MKRTLLLNWVYYRPVGHVVEALKISRGYSLANKNLEIYLLLNSEMPIELARSCSWIEQVYPVSLLEVSKKGANATCLKTIPKTWDYIITDDRVSRFVKNWDTDEIIKTHQVLKDTFKAKIMQGYTEQASVPEILPSIINPKIKLKVPASAKIYAQKFQHKGPSICIMLGGSAGKRQSPTLRAWKNICLALDQAIPNLKIYFTGVSKEQQGRTATLDFPLVQIIELAKTLPNAEVAYNIGLWNQVALIAKCDIFLSPHTGFAFLAPLVSTPWLELANCRWPAYVFNSLPFYSVLPDCGYYPALNDTKKGCGKLLASRQKCLCMRDDLLQNKIPEMVKGTKLLLSENYTYKKAVNLHLQKIRKNYDIKKFYFLGGIQGIVQ